MITAAAAVAAVLLLLIALRVRLDFVGQFFSSIHNSLAKNVYYIKDSISAVRYVSSARTGINALKEKNIYLEIQNQDLLRENERLRRLLQLKETSPAKKHIRAAALVIGANTDGLVNNYIIDRGTDDGVEKGDGVVSEEGVFGRIVFAWPKYSRVQLITDAESRLSVRVERSRVVGILSGAGHNACVIDYVPKEEDIAEGDTVVTSGLGGSFPEGLKVGVVVKADKKTDGLSMAIKVRPFSKILGAGELLVVRK